MIRTGICLIVFTGLTCAAFCQELYMQRTLGGAQFETDSLTFSLREVQDLMHDNPRAVEEFKKARANYSVAGLLGFSGGLLVAVPLVTAVIGGKPEWSLAAAGGVLVLVSIPFTRAFYRHAETAVDDYNNKLPSSRIKGNFYFTGTGAGVVIRF